MVADSWHKRSISSELLSQLPKQIPNRLSFSCLLRAHASVREISSQKHKVQRPKKVVLGNLTDNKVTKRRKCPHVSKDCYTEFIQLLHLQRRRFEVFDLRESQCLIIADLIEVASKWLQVFDDCSVDATMET